MTAQIKTPPTFATGINQVSGSADSSRDDTSKLDITGLAPDTVDYYRFAGPGGELSKTGKIKTEMTVYH